MRVSANWWPILALGFLTGPVFGLQDLGVPGGDWQGKTPFKAWTRSSKTGVTRVEAAGGRALALDAGQDLACAWTVAPCPMPKGIDAQGWSARLYVTCLEGSEGALHWRLRGAEQEKPVAQGRWRVPKGDGALQRLLEAPLPEEVAGAVAEGAWQLELAYEGPAGARLVLDDLAAERFHAAPTRELLGKANGHLGPDLLVSGALGFTALAQHHCQGLGLIEVQPEGAFAKAGLKAGDYLIAIDGVPFERNDLAPGWNWFERSHEARFGRLLDALVAEGRGQFTVTRLAEGKREEVRVRWKPPVADKGLLQQGPLDPRLYEDLIAWTVAHQKKDGSWPGTDAVNPALGGLALLGTGDPKHREAIERCKDFLLAKNPDPAEMKGLAFWTIAFQGWFLAEYHFATGDEAAKEWVRKAVEWLPKATHESKWGTQAFGHGPDGLPYDDKALTAPASHLLVLDALALKAGIDSRVWPHIEQYMLSAWSDPEQGGHGGMGYNASYRDTEEFWCRSGLNALAATLRGDPEGRMTRGLCAFMEERHPWMFNSHAYGEPGAALGLFGLAVADRPRFDRVLPQYRWRFLNAWEPGYGLRWSTPHMGSPYMGEDSIVNLAYAVLGAVDRGSLVSAGSARKK
ncbi:MAG: PDZ domain-containing protein [Planctomycetota bacterium]